MKVLFIVVVGFVLIATGAVFFIMDGGARGEVAIDKALGKIDGFLGKLSVNRKKIKNKMEQTEDSFDLMRRTKIETAVKAESLGKKIGLLEETLQQVDRELGRLRSKLTGPTPVVIGATYTMQDLQRSSTRLIALRKSKAQAITDYKEAQLVMQKTTESLARKQISARQRIDRLESQLTAIDAKAMALMALRSTYAVGGDASMVDQLAELEGMVEDLLVDVETELRVEEEKWDEGAVMGGIAAADTLLLEDLKDPAETVAEINAILGDVSTNK